MSVSGLSIYIYRPHMPGILTVTPICFVATWERRCLSEGYLSALYRLKPIRQRISFSQNITRACFFLSWGAAFLRAFHVKSSSNRILTRRELPILFSTLSLCLTLTGTGKKRLCLVESNVSRLCAFTTPQQLFAVGLRSCAADLDIAGRCQ